MQDVWVSDSFEPQLVPETATGDEVGDWARLE